MTQALALDQKETIFRRSHDEASSIDCISSKAPTSYSPPFVATRSHGAMSTVTSPTSSRTASPAPAPSRNRANKAALRDYYGLKATAPAPPPDIASLSDDSHLRANNDESNEIPDSELDTPGFDADAYVRNLLATQGLAGVLKAEGTLIGEIKGLDGEKKALVYDNYSKLITATDTIRRMRENMGPLTPSESALSPAVAHIAEMTAELATASRRGMDGSSGVIKSETPEAMETKRRQRETVRWVLGTPRRLEDSLKSGDRRAAERDWTEAEALLEKWESVRGVKEVRVACEKVMATSGD